MAIYEFDDDRPVRILNAAKADPQALGEALEVITAEGDGKLKTGDIVNAARDPASVLHRHFEWDDAVCGEAYRRGQAQEIVRLVRTYELPGQPPTRAWLSVADPLSGVAYRSVREVRASPKLQALVLAQAERDLLSFEKRYRDLLDVCELVRAARERLGRRRKESPGDKPGDESRPN